MAEEIQKRLIEDEMKESYVDYAMSVIVGRALPDARDGLKPVHRRVLYTMYNIGLLHNKPFRKSATVVGNVMAKLHPHGDVAIYDTLVRMAQHFSLRYPLIDGQGNFGSVDGDSAAAMRYTEARLSKLAEELLVDIEKETVDFVYNFDNTAKEPSILPAKLPNLLINGSSGIAVGMATNIPPHNIKEVIDAVVAAIDNPNIDISELVEKVPAPDFPTGGFIVGRSGIHSAYTTGRGKILLRAKTHVEEKKDRKSIIVTEIPYQVNKSMLIEAIADLVKDKKVEGISDIRDESDKKGMRVVIELKRGVDDTVLLNQLFKNTQLQTTFGIIMLALVDNQPKVLNLKEIIDCYIKHRKEVVTRRTQYDLKKAEHKAHILEGLKVALSDIDNVIKVVRGSKDPVVAKAELMKKFSLSEMQSQAILEMRLQRLTSLEQDKIKKDYDDTLELIKKLKDILASEQKIFGIIKDELFDIANNFSDARKTQVLDIEEDIEIEELISKEDIVVTVTHSGYIKQLPMDTYKQQRRGGKGIIGTDLKEEDVVEHLFTTANHNYILFFSNKGQVYWLKGYQIPQASRYSKGKAIVNLLNLKEGEKITALVPVPTFEGERYLLMATKHGLLKKTPLSEYSRPRKGGIIGITLRPGDELVKVRLTPGILNMLIATKKGLAVKFSEKDVNAVGRQAMGVRGIRLSKGDEVIGMEVALESGTLLTITEHGYGKRTPIPDYRLIKRGGKGVINIKTNERNGGVIAIRTVTDFDEIILMSEKGVVIRVPASDISSIGRNTQGVTIMKLEKGDKVKTVDRIIISEKGTNGSNIKSEDNNVDNNGVNNS
ncbi:MAG: DNA gyrase subunit A [archaeon]